MAKPTLPPQAYTRETLAQAYEWLNHQAPHIRELATNADRLVGLYMQQSRRKSGVDLTENSTPSSREFKTQLKDLARVADDFVEALPEDHWENNKEHMPPPQPKAKPPGPQPQRPEGYQDPTPATPEWSSSPSAPSAQDYPQSYRPTPPPKATPPPVRRSPEPSPNKPVYPETDAVYEMVREVKQKLNFSSEREAKRVLISLGYSKLKDIL